MKSCFVLVTLIVACGCSDSSKTPHPEVTEGLPDAFPGVEELPDLPKTGDLYVSGFACHWKNKRWKHHVPNDANPITGIWTMGQTTALSGWDEVWWRKGDSWKKQNVESRLLDVWGSHENNIYSVGDSSTILRFVGGESWLTEDAPEGIYSGVWGRDSEEVYAVGVGIDDSRSLIVSSKGDGKWIIEETPTESLLHDVYGNSRDVFAVGEDGVILRKTSKGGWLQEKIDTDEDFMGVWSNEHGDTYAVTSRSVFYSKGDGHWERIHKSSIQLWAVHGLDRTVWVGGSQGVLMLLQGKDWIDCSGDENLHVETIFVSKTDDIWIGGSFYFYAEEPENR
ncbi:MAG: hypothetical protein KDA84_21725 [Planctomycetaceae bacterium]|nr:hypothetical protein [Planctomycetaceae bacterium]